MAKNAEIFKTCSSLIIALNFSPFGFTNDFPISIEYLNSLGKKNLSGLFRGRPRIYMRKLREKKCTQKRSCFENCKKVGEVCTKKRGTTANKLNNKKRR